MDKGKGTDLPANSNTTTDYTLSRAVDEDIGSIIATHLASNELFRGTGLLPDSEFDVHVPADIISDAIRSGFAFVVRDKDLQAVGFALSRAVQRTLYLDQVSVRPEHGRRGIGQALLERTIEEARDLSFRSVTLSTFRDVAWNGPFYRSMGFREIPRRRITSWMSELEAAQAMTMDVSKRCFMEIRTRRSLL